MWKLAIMDTAMETKNQYGDVLSSFEQLEHILSGQPLTRETYTYEMISCTGKTKKEVEKRIHDICKGEWFKPLGQIEYIWTQF